MTIKSRLQELFLLLEQGNYEEAKKKCQEMILNPSEDGVYNESEENKDVYVACGFFPERKRELMAFGANLSMKVISGIHNSRVDTIKEIESSDTTLREKILISLLLGEIVTEVASSPQDVLAKILGNTLREMRGSDKKPGPSSLINKLKEEE